MFIIYIDDSLLILGGVLIQKCQVVSCTSRKLKAHNHNYPTHDLELTTMVSTSKIHRYFIYEGPFEIYTNYHRLKYLFSQKELNIPAEMDGADKGL